MTTARRAAKDVTVAVAVRAELAQLEKRRKGSARSALGAAALALAKELDSPGTPASSKSLCANSLQDILRQLHALAPADSGKGELDEIAARRRRRRSAAVQAS